MFHKQPLYFNPGTGNDATPRLVIFFQERQRLAVYYNKRIAEVNLAVGY